MNINYKSKAKYSQISKQVFLHLIIWVTVLLVMFPFLVTLMFSFKSVAEFNNGLWTLPAIPQLNNYAYSLSIINVNMLNSIVAGLLISFIGVFIASLSAYVFSRYEFNFKNFLFAIVIALMMVPGVLTLTPSYLNIMNLGLHNTSFAVILPGIANSLVAGLFLFKTFMSQHPKDLYENAQLDGASDFVMFSKISIPLSIPVLVIQLVGVFAAQYNDYLWPLLVIDKEQTQMLMPILRNLVADAYDKTLNPGISYAIYICSGIPLIFTSLIGLKYFINGDFASGLKL